MFANELRPRSLGHLTHLVALAGAPRTGRDRVRRVTRRPIAKPIVKLADKHDHLAAEICHRVQLLIRDQRRWVENHWLFTTAAPFDFIERVNAEVEDILMKPPRTARRFPKIRTSFGATSNGCVSRLPVPRFPTWNFISPNGAAHTRPPIRGTTAITARPTSLINLRTVMATRNGCSASVFRNLNFAGGTRIRSAITFIMRTNLRLPGHRAVLF